jgi:hypothetical protein
MARTIIEIYDEMITAKVAMAELNALQPNIDSGQTFLDDLTSASKMAVWRTMFFVVAVGIWTVEKLFDAHVTRVENRAKELIVGNVDWYGRIALDFQYGDALVFDGKEYTYPTVNPANKIVKLVAINEIGDTLFMKVATTNGADPEALTTGQLNAFKAYIHQRKFAGTYFVFISREADLLRIQYRVYIDPLVLNLTGGLISNPSVKPVEDAINDYCKQLPFNGVFSVTALTDKIQHVEGVANPVFQSAQAKYGTNAFVSIGDYYQPNAGYLTVDPTFPLSVSITYLMP